MWIIKSTVCIEFFPFLFPLPLQFNHWNRDEIYIPQGKGRTKKFRVKTEEKSGGEQRKGGEKRYREEAR